jgi:hypothetical protein
MQPQETKIKSELTSAKDRLLLALNMFLADFEDDEDLPPGLIDEPDSLLAMAETRKTAIVRLDKLFDLVQPPRISNI